MMQAPAGVWKKEARHLLESWLGDVRVRTTRPVENGMADLVVEQGRLRLVVEVKATGDSATVGGAIAQVKSYASNVGKKAVPVVAVPFMGEVGKNLCAEAGVSWFDLSGNARIIAPGLRVMIEGRPNRFVRRGRPSSAFAPKSARLARRMLIEPSRSWRQQDLVRATGLDDGFVSRIVQRLEKDQLVERTPEGTLRVRNHDLLLDSWAEAYDFEKHTIIRGHVTARDGEELLNKAAATLEGRIRYAATGLAAAFIHTHFAAFRLATFFVEQHPINALLRDFGFREEPTGANVWLVVPNDHGVFDGSKKKITIPESVHPVQAYLDLKAHPERAREAAAELRARLLRWST